MRIGPTGHYPSVVGLEVGLTLLIASLTIDVNMVGFKAFSFVGICRLAAAESIVTRPAFARFRNLHDPEHALAGRMLSHLAIGNFET